MINFFRKTKKIMADDNLPAMPTADKPARQASKGGLFMFPIFNESYILYLGYF